MKNRVSCGAFDLDQMELPTLLRFAQDGEEIVLLGDTDTTKYKATELAHIDQQGAYSIDINYRDAQRTAVTEKTKNILINVDGIYDIDRTQVEETLQEVIEQITRFCGGKVEVAGIVTAE